MSASTTAVEGLPGDQRADTGAPGVAGAVRARPPAAPSAARSSPPPSRRSRCRCRRSRAGARRAATPRPSARRSTACARRTRSPASRARTARRRPRSPHRAAARRRAAGRPRRASTRAGARTAATRRSSASTTTRITVAHHECERRPRRADRHRTPVADLDPLGAGGRSVCHSQRKRRNERERRRTAHAGTIHLTVSSRKKPAVPTPATSGSQLSPGSTMQMARHALRAGS